MCGRLRTSLVLLAVFTLGQVSATLAETLSQGAKINFADLFPQLSSSGKVAVCAKVNGKNIPGDLKGQRFVPLKDKIQRIKARLKRRPAVRLQGTLALLTARQRQAGRLCKKGAPRPLGILRTSPECARADLNRDNRIEFADLKLILRAQKKRRLNLSLYDLNLDGTLNKKDVKFLLQCWAPHGKDSSASNSSSSQHSSASSSSSFSLDLGDLTIPQSRIPGWSHAGVEGGIPDSTTWPVINALDFGAVPNDGIDDADAINAAINSAAEQAAPTAVLLPAGTYNLLQPKKIILKSNVVLKGGGADKTFIFSSQGSSPSDGIEFKGAEHYETFRSPLIGLQDGKTTLTLERFDFENYYPGFSLEPGSRISLQGSTGLDCDGDGVWETSWGACSGQEVDSVSGSTVTLTRNVILELVSQSVPDQTCAEIGGSICTPSQYCAGYMSITSDSNKCCNQRRCGALNFLAYPSQRPVGGLNRGSDTITLAQAPYFEVGDYVIIRQDNDERIASNAWFAPGIGQIVKVAGLGANSIKIFPALRDDLKLDYNPRITKPDMLHNAGVEDLKIEFGDVDPVPLYKGDVISFRYAINSWVKNVHARNAYAVFAELAESARIAIVDSYFETVQKPDYTNSYALSFGRMASDCLASNNIFEDVWVTGIFAGSANGNVYSYNYDKDIRQRDHGIIHHGTYPFANLIEGNDAYRITHDRWWGRQGPRITYFRNRASEIRTSLNGWETDIVADELNIIGNSAAYFLSFPWCTYPEVCFPFDRDTTNMWAEKNRFTSLLIAYDTGPTTVYVPEPGVCPLAPELCAGFAGPRVKTCNGYCYTQTGYDGLTPPPTWQGFNMPASLYLAGPPSFWCKELPWPALGADIDDYSAELNKLPAQRRYEGLPCTRVD